MAGTADTHNNRMISSMMKYMGLMLLALILTACGGGNLYERGTVQVEARSEQNAIEISKLQEEFYTTKDRFSALESLYVDVAQTLKNQSNAVDNIQNSLAKFQLNPASAKSVEEMKSQVSGIQRNLRVLQSRLAKVELLSGKATEQAPSTAASAGPADSGASSSLGDGSEFAAHVASYREEIQVKAGWESLKQKYPGQFDGLKAVTDEIETAGLGKFVRLLVGPFKNESDAESLCTQIKNNGDFCQVAKFQGAEVK